LRRRLDAPRGNHADLALQLVFDLVCRNLGSFVLCVNLTKNSGELNSRKENGVALQFFFIVAHALGNVRLIAQRLAKSTLDGPYKQFIHTGLWII